eukprot:PITA_26444
MKLTTWNIRGLGSRRKQRNPSNRIKEEKPNMVFSQETKCSMDKITEIHNKWLIKKKGGTRQIDKDSEAFQDFIRNIGLVDTETINGTFTWNNKRGGVSQVASKLERFIIFEDLLLIGPAITASIFPFRGSNHWPVQLEATFMYTPRNGPFRFENAWLSYPKFNSNIDKWSKEESNIQGTKIYMLQQRLKHIKPELKAWNKEEFGDILKAKIETEQKLQEIN